MPVRAGRARCNAHRPNVRHATDGVPAPARAPHAATPRDANSACGYRGHRGGTDRNVEHAKCVQRQARACGRCPTAVARISMVRSEREFRRSDVQHGCTAACHGCTAACHGCTAGAIDWVMMIEILLFTQQFGSIQRPVSAIPYLGVLQITTSRTNEYHRAPKSAHEHR
jgi:hypothetical protein